MPVSRDKTDEDEWAEARKFRRKFVEIFRDTSVEHAGGPCEYNKRGLSIHSSLVKQEIDFLTELLIKLVLRDYRLELTVILKAAQAAAVPADRKAL